MEQNDVQLEQVLMLVKTYPTPSATYGELVCTAGIRIRDNAWVRIYPYPFRLVGEDHRFAKGNIIEIPLKKATDDPRPESYKIDDISKIRKVSHLGTERGWAQRMAYIKPTALDSVARLKTGMFPASEEAKVWGLSILPVRVRPGSARLTWKPKKGWDKKQLGKLKRAEEYVRSNLFVNAALRQSFKELAAVPYEFRLVYEDSTGKKNKHLIIDWEIAQLYFNARRKAQSDEEAVEKVRHKIEEVIFSERNDVYLILGNVHYKYRNANVLAIDGFIWPKRQMQDGLF